MGQVLYHDFADTMPTEPGGIDLRDCRAPAGVDIDAVHYRKRPYIPAGLDLQGRRPVSEDIDPPRPPMTRTDLLVLVACVAGTAAVVYGAAAVIVSRLLGG